MPAGLDSPLGCPVPEAEPVGHDACPGPQFGEQLRPQPPVHLGKQKQGYHGGPAQIGPKKVLLAKLDQALDSGLAGVAARAFDHAPVKLDSDAARAMVPRRGNGDPAVAGAKVVNHIGLRHAGQPE